MFKCQLMYVENHLFAVTALTKDHVTMLNVTPVCLPHYFRSLRSCELTTNRSRLTQSCLVQEPGKSGFCSEHEGSICFENQARGCVVSPPHQFPPHL